MSKLTSNPLVWYFCHFPWADIEVPSQADLGCIPLLSNLLANISDLLGTWRFPSISCCSSSKPLYIVSSHHFLNLTLTVNSNVLDTAHVSSPSSLPNFWSAHTVTTCIHIHLQTGWRGHFFSYELHFLNVLILAGV